ncbi:MAG: hypothetical protein JNK48_03895 [Bryobacterales bacterium]|nr:hypothetical protein [Bryobacterales bacterium]
MRTVLFMLLLLKGPVLAEETITLRWNELNGALANRTATVTLTDDRRFTGVVRSVNAEALAMDRVPSGRIERSAIREIRVRRIKGPRRAIFAAGIGAGTAFATLPWAISDSRINVSDGARIAQWAGIAAAATAAGYFIGRHLDGKETIIRIAAER